MVVYLGLFSNLTNQWKMFKWVTPCANSLVFPCFPHISFPSLCEGKNKYDNTLQELQKHLHRLRLCTGKLFLYCLWSCP